MKTLATLVALCALGATVLAPSAQAIGDVDPDNLYDIYRPNVLPCDGDLILFTWEPDLNDPATLVPSDFHGGNFRCLP